MTEFAVLVKELGAVGVLAFLAVYVVVRLEPVIRETKNCLRENKKVTEINIATTKELLILLRSKNGKSPEARRTD